MHVICCAPQMLRSVLKHSSSSRLSLVACRYKQHGSVFKSNIIGEMLSCSRSWLEGVLR